jgi:hypothetical protein
MPLVVSLLEELRVPSEAVECTLLPAVDQYAIRLPASRAMGGAVLLPRRALEQALVDPTARARVRNLLQTWVETTGARRAAGEAGLLASYFSALDVGSRPGPRCVRCGGPLLAEDAVAVYEASRWHLVCPPAW